MSFLLRIVRDLISTQPAPVIEDREAVTAAALPVLTAREIEAEKPHPILDQYDIVFITPGARWEEIDLFLLAEEHFNDECNKTNGAFIRAFGGDEVTVCMESVPSMQELPVDEQEESREKLGLSGRVRFIGWDACEEIQDMLHAGEGSVEQNLAATQEEIQEVVRSVERHQKVISMHYRMTEIIDQFRSADSEEDSDSGETFGELEKNYQRQKKLLGALHQKEQVLKRFIERNITHIVSDPLKSTFPLRTRAMVETLQRLRKIDSKVFLIGGQAHLQSIPVLNSQHAGPEFDLRPMREELAHHKAAILVPKICEGRKYADVVIDRLILPKGLVLTEEQKSELKEKLFSQATTTEETIHAFLQPILIPYFAKMEIALDKTIDKLELPEGLILTKKQKAELKKRILTSIARSEDVKATTIAFIQPILDSFFLRTAEK